MTNDKNVLKRSFLFSVLAVLFISPDSILIRISQMNDFTVTFWRSMGAIVTIGIFLLITKNYKNIKFTIPFFTVAIISGLAQSLFVLSVKNADIATVLIIVACAPMIFSIILSYIFLKFKTPKQTYIAISFCIIGSILVVFEKYTSSGGLGIIYVLLASLALSITLMIIEKYKHIDMLFAFFLGGVIVAVISLIATDLNVFPDVGMVNYVAILSCGLIVQAGFHIFTSYGAKHTPAPLFTMLLLLETIIAISLGAILLNEIPSKLTLLGGVIVISSITLHSIWHLKKAEKVK